jgi:hypothetical protein
MIMEFINAMADLIGISSTALITIGIAGIALVVGWYVLKTALKLAARTFAIGCMTIIGLVVGLYIVFVVLQAQ